MMPVTLQLQSQRVVWRRGGGGGGGGGAIEKPAYYQTQVILEEFAFFDCF